MIDNVAAQRYARALFEISREAGRDQWVEDELAAISSAIKGSLELKSFLENPRVSFSEKKKFLGKLFLKNSEPFSETLMKFYSLLLEKTGFL